MITPLFFGEVKDGKMTVENRQKMVEWIRTLEGKKVQVVIERKKRKRTSGKKHEEGNQNGYYWSVVLPIVADYVGEDKNTMHDILVEMYAPKIARDVLGQRHLVTVRSKNMDTVQFKEYVDTIVRKMDELDVKIPPPNKVRIK